MRRHALILALASAVACGEGTDEVKNGDSDGSTTDPTTPVTHPINRLGFGSCSDQNLPLSLLNTAAGLAPDLYVWTGDNIYSDTEDVAIKQATYDALAQKTEYQSLAAVTDFIATWDDHDYGDNDAGAEYPSKVESQAAFLDFWGEPADSARRSQEGVYTSYVHEGSHHTLQIILLDTRYHRGPLTPNEEGGLADYVPSTDANQVMLGETQWAWLEERLLEPADVRVIVSATQFGHEYNGWESWTNLPLERQRMLDLITSTGASGVVFLSGDVHYGEISKIGLATGYDLYDITSSGINRVDPNVLPNANRVGEGFGDMNVGMLDFDWENETITASLFDAGSNPRVTTTFSFEDIAFD